MSSSEKNHRSDFARREPTVESLEEPGSKAELVGQPETVTKEDLVAQKEPKSSAEVDREHVETLRQVVSGKTERRIRARQRPNESIWAFMGTFGIVGWSVTVPTLAALALGVFLDSRTDSERSFTLTFLILGVSLGCVTAWYWVRRESRGEGR